MPTSRLSSKSRKPFSLSAAVAAVLLAGGSAPHARAAIADDTIIPIAGTPNTGGLFGQVYGLQQPAVAGAEPSISATATASTNFTASGFPLLQTALSAATVNSSGYSNVNFNNTAFGNNAPFSAYGSALTDNLTARWSGYINIDATQAGATTFFTTSDDGSIVYVDGARVVNNNQFQGAVERSGSITLTAGLHEVVVGFYEGTGGAGVEFRYDPAGADAKQIVPVVIPAGSTAPAGQQVLSGVQNTVLTPADGAVTFNTAGKTGGVDISYALQVNMGALTFAGNNTLNHEGAAARYTSTTFNGGGTNVLAVSTGSAFSQDIALGQLNDNGTAVRLQKTGPGQLVLDQTTVANSMVSGSVFEIRGGGVVVAGINGGNNPLGSASIELGSTLPSPAPTGVTIPASTLTLTSKTGNFTLDNAINVTSSNLIVALQLAAPAGNTTLTQAGAVGVPSAPTTVANGVITLGSATNGITVQSGATATFQANNGYTLDFAGGITGAGNVAFNPGIFTINKSVAPGGTLAAAGTSTFNLNVANSVNKNLVIPGNGSVINYNANSAGGGNQLGVTGTGSQVNIAAAVTSIGADSFNIGATSILGVPSAAVAGQFTRGTNLTIGTGSVIAEAVAGANNAIGNLGTASDLFFGLGANLSDSMTVGSIPGVTPWRGISTDRTARTLTGGTITALSNFQFSSPANVNLDIAGITIATPNGPVVASLNMGTARVRTATTAPTLGSDVTFTLNSGAFQLVVANSLGSSATASANASIVAYPGTTVDPNGVANAMSGNIFLRSGGILQLNDANNLGGIGGITGEPGAVVQLQNATALANANAAQNLTTLPAGVVYRLEADLGATFPTQANPAGNFQVQAGNRTETVTISSGSLTRGGFVSGLLTNDGASRTLSGGVTIGSGGGILASTATFTLTIGAPITVSAAAPLTIGTTRVVDVATNGDIRSGTVILSGTTNNFSNLTQLNLVGRSNLQNLAASGVSALPQGASLPVSLGGVYQINGGSGGGTSTIQLGQLTPQGGNIFLNRSATTPDALVVSLNAPISRSNTFGAGARGSVVFQTVTGQALGTNDKVLFVNAADAPPRISGATQTLNMVSPWMIGTDNAAQPAGATFLDVDPASAATTGFKPVTYVAMPLTGGTGDEIADNTAGSTLTGPITVGALRTSANISGQTINLSTGGFLFRGSAAAVTVSSAINFGANEGIISNISGQANTISGALSGTGGLTKLGGNSLALSNTTSTLTGGVTINEANLRPGADNGIPQNNVLTINAAGTLDLNNFNQTFRGLQGNGVVNNQTGAVKTLTINTANAGDSFDFTGTIRNAAQPVAFTKSGPGTQILSGTLGYTGATTVSAGRLVVDGVSTAVSAYTVAANATLAGSGIITGAVSGSASGTIAPGGLNVANAVGQLRTGALTLASGANLALDLNGAIAGAGIGSSTGYDQVDVVGAVSLAGANLQLQLNYAPTIGDKLFVLNNDQIDAIAGTFASLNGVATPLSQGSLFNLTSTFDSQSYQFQISYTGEFYGGATSNIGNDVVLVAVPEPSSVALIGLAALGLLGRRRQRSAS